MIVFTIVGMICSVFFIIYFFVTISNYIKERKNKRKELIDFKNKIEDDDLKKSWVKFLEKKHISPYWDEKLNW
jgi:predicted membrane protein